MKPSPEPGLRSALRPPKHGLRQFAAEQHLELETELETLERAGADIDPHALTAQWNVVGAALREHLAAEEDLIIPAYQLSAPEEGSALRDDHARLRGVLEDIEQDVRRHVLDRGRVRELLALLRAHAEREDAAMYPWAEENLSQLTRRQLYLRITRWLHPNRR